MYLQEYSSFYWLLWLNYCFDPYCVDAAADELFNRQDFNALEVN